MFKYTNEDYRVHLTLGTMSPYDKLHTVLKGILELCLRWVVAIIIIVGRKDAKYRDTIAELDTRIINFPIGHSITPFGDHLFPKGISVLFKDGPNRDYSSLEKSVGQGGRVEAQRLSALLWQV